MAGPRTTASETESHASLAQPDTARIVCAAQRRSRCSERAAPGRMLMSCSTWHASCSARRSDEQLGPFCEPRKRRGVQPQGARPGWAHARTGTRWFRGSEPRGVAARAGIPRLRPFDHGPSDTGDHAGSARSTRGSRGSASALRRALGATLELDAETSPQAGALIEAEAAIGRLVQFAKGERPRQQGHAWLIASALLLAAVAAVALPRLRIEPAWTSYEWRASSTLPAHAQTGRLEQQVDGFFFHTAEERGPSLLIDMKAPRFVKRIVLKDRQDCCFERVRIGRFARVR